MHFLTHTSLESTVVEHDFLLDDIPGILWLPHDPPRPSPLIVLGHPGGLERMRPRLRGRGLDAARAGYASVALELPGAGIRPPLADVDAARRDLQSALSAGTPVTSDIVDRLVLPLVAQAVPEWRRLIDAVLALREVSEPVAVSGGVVAIALRLAAVDDRIAAAGLFAGSYVPAATMSEAKALRIPVHMLLQWDDRGNDRQMALDLFDAIGSEEKTLEANMGGHTGVPAHAGESMSRFFRRHLHPPAA